MPIPDNYARPSRLTAKERVFNQLQHWIIDGTLEPGEKLYDGEIAETFGISRTPVREALQLLQMQGFVETYRGKETKVTTITKEDVLKIYPPLAVLQSLAAEIAADTIRQEQIERLKNLNREYEKAIYENQPFQAMEIDEDFHNLIMEVTNNPYISDFTSVLQLHLRRLKYIFLIQELPVKEESLKEHESIIEAFQNRDRRLAAEVMKQNWVRPMNEVYNVLTNSE